MTIPTKDKNENDLKILLGENNLQENEAQTPQAIALAKLHPFHEHPYKVEDNDEMAELCESICTHGVLSPILVRPTEDGEYEIVSGHRRVFACHRLGLKDVPAIVQPMTQEEAVLKMVDSNLHRERLLPSEKAFAYKMKLDAIKHKGKSLSQVATKSDSAAEVGAAMGESRDMVFRYIRLTNLVPPLLDMVDEGKIALMPAERLSYLTEEEQLALADIMEDLEVTPSLSQAVKLKDLSASHRLDPDSMYEVM